MPYRTRGRKIQVKRGSKWVTRGKSTSKAKAKRAVRVLRAIKHGWTPTRRRR